MKIYVVKIKCNIFQPYEAEKFKSSLLKRSESDSAENVVPLKHKTDDTELAEFEILERLAEISSNEASPSILAAESAKESQIANEPKKCNPIENVEDGSVKYVLFLSELF